MSFKPFPYQEKIIDFILNHKRGAVWAGMGMGKTVSALTAVSALKFIGELERPALVIAPLRVAKTTWPDEVEKWGHLDLTVSVVAGTRDQRIAALKRKADVYTINYENLYWLVMEYYGPDWPFGMVIADESTRLKGFRLRQGTKNARALARVAHRQTERFIELTGTPAPNGLEDLWGQMWFVDMGDSLGLSFKAFHDRWFKPRRVGSNAFAVEYDPVPGADKQIEAAVKDKVVKVNPEDWFDIEKPIVRDVIVKLEGEAKAMYNEMERNFFLELNNGVQIEAVNAAVKSGKCLQLASGAVYQEDGVHWNEVHTAKLEALESIVNESGGAPLLVAYSYKHEAERILAKFPKAKLLDKNPQTVRDWNAGKIPMLLAHPASCGHGLNLQDGGNILVFFSCGWNLEHHDQIIERLGPMRQKQAGHPRPVFIYYIRTHGTLDMAVKERLTSKREVMDILLEKKNEKDAEKEAEE